MLIKHTVWINIVEAFDSELLENLEEMYLVIDNSICFLINDLIVPQQSSVSKWLLHQCYTSNNLLPVTRKYFFKFF